MRRLLRRVRHGQERVQLWLRWLSNVDAGHAVLGRQLRHDPLGCASDGNPSTATTFVSQRSTLTSKT